MYSGGPFGLDGCRANDDGHPAVFERFTGPCLPEDGDGLFEDADATLLVDTEHEVLVGSVAEAERQRDAAVADDVEDGEILSEADRVVQHGDER